MGENWAYVRLKVTGESARIIRDVVFQCLLALGEGVLGVDSVAGAGPRGDGADE